MKNNEERDPEEDMGGKICPGMMVSFHVKVPLALRLLFTESPLKTVGAKHWPSHDILPPVKDQQCHLHALANGLHFMAQF